MAQSRRPVAWSIAGSDSGGASGIQADLCTFKDLGVYCCTAITAVTAQNSFAVGHIAVTSKRAMAAQINALDSDFPADAIKVGMLASDGVAQTVCNYLDDYSGPVVFDPVIRASSGDALVSDDAMKMMRKRLLPRADVITPNRNEAGFLLGRKLQTIGDVETAAQDLIALGGRSVLITGGHFETVSGRCLDYWCDATRGFWIGGRHINSVHSRGSGCTLSSAIAACLARGMAVEDALVLARAYVAKGLRYAVQMGSGPGAVAHMGWPDSIEDWPVVADSPEDFRSIPFPDCDRPLGLYPVVDSAKWVRRVLAAGADTVQLRIKNQTPENIKKEIRAAVEAVAGSDARLVINDYWREAIDAGAWGVHLGQEDLATANLDAIHSAGLRLGISTHSDWEVARAHAARPSYIAIGPVYATTSKDMLFAPQGLARLKRWVAMLGPQYTLTAIGGIGVSRAAGVLATGVGSCAMISAITEAADPEAVVAELVAMHRAVE